jgi:F0F1-type ATP synthase delta subunit
MRNPWLKEILLADQVGQIKADLASGKVDYQVKELIEQVAKSEKKTVDEAKEIIKKAIDGVEEVVVEAARDKPEEYWLDMARKIKTRCGDNFVLSVKVKPDLMAGARVALKGKWFDGSIKTTFTNWWQKSQNKYV